MRDDPMPSTPEDVILSYIIRNSRVSGVQLQAFWKLRGYTVSLRIRIPPLLRPGRMKAASKGSENGTAGCSRPIPSACKLSKKSTTLSCVSESRAVDADSNSVWSSTIFRKRSVVWHDLSPL